MLLSDNIPCRQIFPPGCSEIMRFTGTILSSFCSFESIEMMSLNLECGKEATNTKIEMAYQLDSCFARSAPGIPWCWEMSCCRVKPNVERACGELKQPSQSEDRKSTCSDFSLWNVWAISILGFATGGVGNFTAAWATVVGQFIQNQIMVFPANKATSVSHTTRKNYCLFWNMSKPLK